MTFTEYSQYDALGLAELVRRGEISAPELAHLAIARCEAVNPHLNAVIEPLYELAHTMAAAIDPRAPFAGVPFLLKDLGLELAGHKLGHGSRGYAGYRSALDSYLVARYRRAGLVFMGRTNTPEFGLTPYTEPLRFGPTRNPWDPSRTAGGSSGGSGAAVAAGIVPLATASDGGGSIRIPASNNGLVGLKPSRGRLSLGPQVGEGWSGAIVEGCVSWSVRDTAAFLDMAAVPEPGELYYAPPPARPFADEVGQNPGRLRIGFSVQHTLGHTPDPDCVAAVRAAAQLLADLGHEVEETPLPYQREDLTEVFLTMTAGETQAQLRRLAQHLGRPVRPGVDVEENTYALALLGATFTAGDFAYQKQRWNEIARRQAAFHQRFDLLLTATVSQAPFVIGSMESPAWEQRLVQVINRLKLKAVLKSQVDPLAEKIFGYIPYTPLANITGQPSISLPLHYTASGLPVGVMCTAPLYREDWLLQLAGQLEQAQPWRDRRPDGL